MSEHMMPIPSRVYNAAVGGHVCGAVDIIDDALGLEQSSINEDVAPMPYNDGNPNGMGRIILKKTDNFKNVVEAQSGNTIFIIKYDFTLTGNVTVPANCILEFDGGSISDDGTHTLTGNFAINDVEYKIFNNITFVEHSTILKVDHIRPEWFGAKGDFNPSTKIGTDDSTAINAAINAAEVTGVNKVKFSSVNYLITSGIHITKGNIWLEGCYAMLREEEWDDTNNVIVNLKTSTLWASDNTNLITVDTTVKNPIRITNLQMSGVNIGANTKGINFTATFGGPTWPFIVENCHLRFFTTAISFNSTTLYCVSNVRINNNAFWHNQWCVVFEERTEDANHFHTNITWNFDFCNNCAHQNTHLLNIHVSYGTCNIINNNMEGNSVPPQSDTIVYLNKIGLSQGAKLNFHNNHFESITLKALYIEYFLNECYVSINRNNTRGVSGGFDCVDFNKYKGNSAYCPVILEECDLTANVLNGGNFICEKQVRFNLIGRSNIQVFTNIPYTKGSLSLVDIYNKDNISDFKMCGGIFESKKTGNSYRNLSVQGDTSGEKKCLNVFLAYSPEGFMNNSFYLFNTSTIGSPILTSKNNKKYLYSIYQEDIPISSVEVNILSNNPQYINSAGAILISADESTNVSTDILSDITNITNAVNNITNINTVDSIKVGDYLFDKATNKRVYWTGSSWVDATGNPV